METYLKLQTAMLGLITKYKARIMSVNYIYREAYTLLLEIEGRWDRAMVLAEKNRAERDAEEEFQQAACGCQMPRGQTLC
jgi:hypothetical protein